MSRKTEQESFWEGEFGTEYIARNRGNQLIAGNTHLFSDVFRNTRKINSLIEFGANIGNNLIAIRQLLPQATLSAVEINATAVDALKELQKDRVVQNIHHQSILDFDTTERHEMALIKGVLIHIAPDELSNVYQRLYRAAERYVCIVEYYNPTPVEVPYRGHRNRLFKRDFAGEMMDLFPDLRLAGYGFFYHRDPNFPLDDMNWFLLEKQG